MRKFYLAFPICETVSQIDMEGRQYSMQIGSRQFKVDFVLKNPIRLALKLYRIFLIYVLFLTFRRMSGMAKVTGL